MTQSITVIRGFNGFTFDAVFEVTHDLELEVTDNPVETGVSITDHAYMKPYKVTMQVGVSNNQMHVTNDAFGLGDQRTKTALRELRKMMQRREPFTVLTGLDIYYNMLALSIQVVENAESANSAIFNVTLREIIIVDTQTVTYPPRKKGKAANQAKKKTEQGEKQGKEPEAPKKASLAKRITGVLKK